MKRKICAAAAASIAGGLGYGLTELLVRGRTHITMGLMGALAMLIIHLLADEVSDAAGLFLGALVSAFFITCCEFAAGEYLNVSRGLKIWNYSRLPLNIDGQVCLRYSAAWFALSLAGFGLDRLIRKSILPTRQRGWHYIQK